MNAITTTAPAKSPAKAEINLGGISAAIMLPTIMQALDSTIANVALPYMQGSFSASQEQIAWVLTSYIVAAAIMTPPTGWLAGRFGRKRMFVTVVFGFTIASMLCGMATTLTQIVAFRLLQGMFGASLVPLSQSVLLDAFPRERHGSAMALWGLGVMVGPILGPTLGGYLTDHYNWRWVFYINLPIGVIALLLISAFVPETDRDRSRNFDFFGFGMLSLAVGSLQLMLDRGENLGWFGSTEIIVECVLSGLCFYLFLVQTLTAERPFISPGLFRDRNFVGCMLCMFTVGVVLFSSMALLPPFLQSLMNYPVMTIGNVLAPRGAGTMLAMLIVGRLITRADPRLMILFGMTLTATSLWQMSGFDTDITPRLLITTGLLQGFGLGFIFVPLSTIAFSTLAPQYRGEATGVFNLMRNIGSSIGISICFALVSQFTQINHAALVEHVTPFNPLFQSPSLPEMWDLSTASGAAALDHMITAQAATIGYLNDFKLMMWMILGLAPLVMILQRPRFAPSKDAVAVMD